MLNIIVSIIKISLFLIGIGCIFGGAAMMFKGKDAKERIMGGWTIVVGIFFLVM